MIARALHSRRRSLTLSFLALLVAGMSFAWQWHALTHVAERLSLSASYDASVAETADPCVACDLLAGGLGVPDAASEPRAVAAGSIEATAGSPPRGAAPLRVPYLSRAPPSLG